MHQKMSNIILRNYQDDMIVNTRIALRSHRRVLLQAPTGAGKTVIASYMLDNVSKKNKKGWFICHRRELVDQTAKTFEKFGIDFGFVAAGYPQNFYQPIQICSIDTLKNRLDKVPHPDFCIWDEAHHVGAKGWERVMAALPDAYHVGLSATPERLDGKGLDKSFDFLVPGPQTSWLIENQFLAEYKLYSIPGVDRSQLHTQMGDFVKSESAREMGKPRITGDIIAHWKKHGQEKLTLGFAVNVNHSIFLAEQFNAAGIPAAHVDGNTETSRRKNILRELAKGKNKVIFNVGLFGEGYDIAANSGMDVTIGCIIDAAPTQSLCAWLQRCGRTLRPQNGYAVILDHAGNAVSHGLPCNNRSWTLEGREGSRRKTSESAGSSESGRQCDKCFFFYKIIYACCPECGNVNKTKKIKTAEGELEETDPGLFRQQVRQEQQEAKTSDQLQDLQKIRGHKPGWADHIARAREEKELMRKQLYNLTVGARSLGMNTISKTEIYNLKPKALKEHIAALETKMRVA